MSIRRTSNHSAAESIVDELARLGLRDVIISPGSRNAPLVIAAHHHPALKLMVALDERSAAHIALGMTLENRRPVAVISTSGTAAVNHGPALAEAHYAGHPLISVTADRGVEARQRGHGQTVRQPGLFDAHVRMSLDLDELSMSEFEMREAIRESWTELSTYPRGPVHVNVPLDEPLYEQAEGTWSQPDASELSEVEVVEMPNDWVDCLCGHSPRVLLLAGGNPDSWLGWSALEREATASALCSRVVFWPDRLSGLANSRSTPYLESLLAHWKGGEWPEELRPEVVITVGLPPMSKAIREALQSFCPVHLHMGGGAWDIWGAGVSEWRIHPRHGLGILAEALPEQNAFADLWQVQMDQAQFRSEEERVNVWGDEQVFSDLSAFFMELREPPHAIHFANSTSVRQMQKVAWPLESRLHANRGVAGIDGCVSTAVGDALMNPHRPVVLVTGDTAWLYDLNGLHVQPFPQNLKILVIDNAGGDIFRGLPGPMSSGLCEPYFAAPPKADFRASAELHGLHWFGQVEEGRLFMNLLTEWYRCNQSSLLVANTRFPH